ncbi:S-adenosyl-L-methionine-dependent methyltransferase [Ophiocordyceps camponoti-floridani]|uniref:S-adenosyl-L-methionine-dependent methyltransferase n=1 Tax=Ophiocordyceps camponoti-floridani TaxID=2030778 RepID=A0A8H4QAY9_9HYPO|nr:S-adenosyl-L-methionine-dependent methyltransferase [Ophiocordyceps camponoti-floridani]
MTQLSSLARRLGRLADEIDGYGPVAGVTTLPVGIEAARRELLELAEEIQYHVFACLRWLLHFNIFQHMPRDSTAISYTRLATLASVPEGKLRSVVRMAMTSGLFTEQEAGFPSHNRLSLSFAVDESLRDWAAFIIRYGQPSAAAFTEATVRWGDSQALDQTAQNIALDTDLGYFDAIKQREGAVDEFARYMSAIQKGSCLRHDHVVRGIDWVKRFGERAHVVDVGGSTGGVSASLAGAYPLFTFTVQDLPETTRLGPAAMASLPEDISRRISFEEHDFFTAQPTPADVYLVRLILHDWPREEAKLILSRLSTSLQKQCKPGSLILIMETVLPAPATVPPWREAKLRCRDMTMLASFNSGERELGDLRGA